MSSILWDCLESAEQVGSFEGASIQAFISSPVPSCVTTHVLLLGRCVRPTDDTSHGFKSHIQEQTVLSTGAWPSRLWLALQLSY